MPELPPRTNLRVYDNPEEVARAVASRFVEVSREAIETRGRFSVALAGGSTPKRVYELLASEEWRAQVAWARVHVFFGDERCVPPEHPDSNFRMARESLLARVPLPAENVRRLRGEGDPAESAAMYEAALRAFFDGEPWPRFDLVMLGMGDDGHTASLFPGSPALREQTAWVVAAHVEKLRAYRLTLTLPAINHAENVMFVVTGASKSERLREVLAAPKVSDPPPAQLVRPTRAPLEWFLDKAAAPDFLDGLLSS